MKLDITLIRTDGGTQTRAEIDLIVVADYAGRMQEGVTFPPVVVFFDGTDRWLGDGFHRVNATKAAGLSEIDADVRQGTRRDAILFSVGANASHGKQRSPADRRRAIEVLLRDDEWSQNSDNWIAKTANVDHKTVTKVREHLGIPKSPERKTADGRVMNTANIGKAPKAETSDPKPAPKPRAPAHEPNPFDDDDGEEEPPVVAELAPVALPVERVRGFGQSDVADRLARVSSAVRRFDFELRAAFAGVDPRFDAEVRDRAQDFLLNAAETIRDFFPSEQATRPALAVIRGGKS